MKNHYRLWIALSLVIVFAAGVLGGILLDKYAIDKRPRKKVDRKGPVRFPSIEDMAVELNLTPEQQEKIREVFRNNEGRFKTLRKDIDARLKNMRSQLKNEINSVLTEEQRQKFEAMIQKYISQRKKEEMERRKDRPDRHRNERKDDRDHPKKRCPR